MRTLNQYIAADNKYVERLLEAAKRSVCSMYNMPYTEENVTTLEHSYKYRNYVRTYVTPNLYKTYTHYESEVQQGQEAERPDGKKGLYSFKLPTFSVPRYHYVQNMLHKFIHWENSHKARYNWSHIHHSENDWYAYLLKDYNYYESKDFVDRFNINGFAKTYELFTTIDKDTNAQYGAGSSYKSNAPKYDFEVYIMDRWNIEKSKAVSSQEANRIKFEKIPAVNF
jgi:hypothetical protein